MRRLAALILILFMPLFAAAADLSPEQELRYHALIQELRCLVCQNQTIADSNAPLASDLREQVRSQILAGRSDEEIKDYAAERFGDFVLYRPRLTTSTLLLWLGPLLLVSVALAFALLHQRRSRAAKAPATVDEAALKRLLEEQK